MGKNAVERRCLRTYVSRFADGKAATPYRQFMGYHHSKDGTPEVMEAKAKIVRTIFRRFLEGATPVMISR